MHKKSRIIYNNKTNIKYSRKGNKKGGAIKYKRLPNSNTPKPKPFSWKIFRSSKKEPKITAGKKEINYQDLHTKLGLGKQSLFNLPGAIKQKYASSTENEKKTLKNTLRTSGFSDNNINRLQLPTKNMTQNQSAELARKLQSALKSRAQDATTLNLLAELPQNMNIPIGRNRPNYTQTGKIIAKAAELSKKTNNPEIEERAKELRKYLANHGNTISEEHRRQVSNELNVLREKNLNNQTVVLGEGEKLFKKPKSAFQQKLLAAKKTLETINTSKINNRSDPNLNLYKNETKLAEKTGHLMETTLPQATSAPIPPPPPPPPPLPHTQSSNSGVKLLSINSNNSKRPVPSTGNSRARLLAAIRDKPNLQPVSKSQNASSSQESSSDADSNLRKRLASIRAATTGNNNE